MTGCHYHQRLQLEVTEHLLDVIMNTVVEQDENEKPQTIFFSYTKIAVTLFTSLLTCRHTESERTESAALKVITNTVYTSDHSM